MSRLKVGSGFWGGLELRGFRYFEGLGGCWYLVLITSLLGCAGCRRYLQRWRWLVVRLIHDDGRDGFDASERERDRVGREISSFGQIGRTASHVRDFGLTACHPRLNFGKISIMLSPSIPYTPSRCLHSHRLNLLAISSSWTSNI